MIVLQKTNHDYIRIIALFGLGLIGRSIYKHLLQNGPYDVTYLPFGWNSIDKCKSEGDKIINYISSLQTKGGQGAHGESGVAFIWCAGKAGFSATKDHVCLEYEMYKVFLGIVERCFDSPFNCNIFVNLVSSAGGLFEGQKLAKKESMPKPLRNYGWLKYKQEKSLLKFNDRMLINVYRPTSVYGYAGGEQRMGLIPTLISNGIQQKQSFIVGNMSTLRDYVFNDDIGRFISSKIFDNHESGIHLLGSGKPSSISEVKHYVERVIGRKIYVNYVSNINNNNSMDITVATSSLPLNWKCTSIADGIRIVKERLTSKIIL